MEPQRQFKCRAFIAITFIPAAIILCVVGLLLAMMIGGLSA